MTAPRLLGLFLAASMLAVTAVSAQTGLPPGVKLPVQIKPGMPPTGPGKPAPKVPSTPAPKPPTPGPGVPTTPGLPTIPSVSGSTSPAPKKDDVKWPSKVDGKTPEAVVKEMQMRATSDPAVREAAVRMLPLFGPKGREVGAEQLIETMKNDGDLNVRLAALSVAPTVLFAYATVQDIPLRDGINAILSMMGANHPMHVRFEALGAAAGFGPYFRVATNGKAISVITDRGREGASWHMRRVAAAALGAVGQGVQRGDDPAAQDPPDQGAVGTLLEMLRYDNCAPVRREAVNSLISLGPVAPTQQKRWRADLDAVLAREKDKAVLLWTRTCILVNDPNGVKGNEVHLDAVAKVLDGPEPGGKLEACKALGLIGDDASAKLQDLINVINNPKEEPVVVAAAIAAASTMKSQAKIILPIVDKMKFGHPNEDVRKIAAEASDILSGRKKQ